MNTVIPEMTSDVLQVLEAKIRDFAECGIKGDKIGLARFYADDALITDLQDMWIKGRKAIDRYWMDMPPFQEWQLTILDTGGDAQTPYQRISSTAWLEIDGQHCVDMGHSLLIWKKQPDGDYRIYLDIYRLSKFEAPAN